MAKADMSTEEATRGMKPGGEGGQTVLTVQEREQSLVFERQGIPREPRAPSFSLARLSIGRRSHSHLHGSRDEPLVRSLPHRQDRTCVHTQLCPVLSTLNVLL